MENGNQPVTKQDLADLEREIKLAFQEAIHDSETRLLTAFHAFAEANYKRLIDLERVDGSFRERFLTLEERVLKIEKRLDLPSSS